MGGQCCDEGGNGRDMVVDCLHEQRPRLLAEPGEAALGQGAVLEVPVAGRLDDEARFDFAFAGEPGEFVGLERVAPRLPGIPDQQRLLLPVVAQETIAVEMAQSHDGRVTRVRPRRAGP